MKVGCWTVHLFAGFVGFGCSVVWLCVLIGLRGGVFVCIPVCDHVCLFACVVC